MQAGVRKKELLNRINATDKNPSQTGPLQQNPQVTHPIQHQPPQPQPQQPPQQQQQQEPKHHPQQQRPLSQRAQQSLNQSSNSPNQATTPSPNNSVPAPTQRPNVKTRLQMARGSTQPQQAPRPSPEQQWKQPQQNQQQLLQQRKNITLQNTSRPGAQIQSNQLSQNNVPLTPSMGHGQHLTPGPKPGAKRTVMQRAKNSGIESQQVPQKVRVVKLSGAVSIRFLFLLGTTSLCFVSSFEQVLMTNEVTVLKGNATDCPYTVYCVI